MAHSLRELRHDTSYSRKLRDDSIQYEVNDDAGVLFTHEQLEWLESQDDIDAEALKALGIHVEVDSE